MFVKEICEILRAETFEGFLVDSSNKEAYDTCRLFCKLDSTLDALIVSGHEGCGKTHLLRAVMHEELSNGKKVKYTVGETVASTILSKYTKCENKETFDFFQIYIEDRELIIIDDIDFLLGKEFFEKHFIRFINAALQNNIRLLLCIRDYSAVEKIVTVELREKINSIKRVNIGRHNAQLRKKWINSVMDKYPGEIPQEEIDRIVDSTEYITECYIALIRYGENIE